MRNSTVQIPKFTELVFEEKRHIYRLDGSQIPSVSMVMRPLSNSYYGGIDEDFLNAAAKRGREVHQAIENFLLFGIDDLPPEHEGYYRAFKAWWKSTAPELLETESRAYHRIYRYAGTTDMACVIGGMVYCIDFKTSSQIVEMLGRVQLESYAKAYESHGYRFDAKAIVHLQKDGKFTMKVFEAGDTEAWAVFCALLEVQNYIQKYRR